MGFTDGPDDQLLGTVPEKEFCRQKESNKYLIIKKENNRVCHCYTLLITSCILPFKADSLTGMCTLGQPF